MIIITILTYIVAMLFYFGIIRLLDSKKKEFLQFLVIYLFAMLCVVSIDCIFAKETTRLVSSSGSMLLGFMIHIFGRGNFANIHDPSFAHFYKICTVVLFCVCPTFLISYLLYPFKTMKRSRVLIVFLSIISALMLGIDFFFNIAIMIGLMFSNM